MPQKPNRAAPGGARSAGPLGRITRLGVVPLLLLCAGIRIGMSLERAARRPAPAERAPPAPEAPSPAPEPAPAEHPACEVTGSFQNNLYPSLLLSFGTTYPEYARCLTVALRGLPASGDVELRLDSALFLRPLQVTVDAASGAATLSPELPWNYDLLRRISQVEPQAFVALVSVDGKPAAQATAVCTVHAINEAVSRVFSTASGQWQDTSVCFAAFVNEDHPWISTLLQEAVAASGIRAFNGYQSGPQGAQRQVQAVWEALAARGLTYVNVATDSGTSPFVSTQYVRFLDQSVREQGANCVDASVLFASVLRRIGLRPVLLFRPGHCFAGYYDAEEGGNLVAFEPTMLGSAPFAASLAEGSRELQSTMPFIGTSQYSVVDIALCRRQGINPIGFQAP